MSPSYFNLHMVLRTIGVLLSLLALFMLLPLGVSLCYGEDDFSPFLLTIGITLAVGGGLSFVFRRCDKHLGKREGYFIVATSWIFFSFFGMLPYMIGGYIPRIEDAFFETMSGFTTTGSSILNDIEALPHGILFWRSMTQWLGGMGIILFTLAVMPMLNSGGGIQLFNAEVPGMTHDKMRPRISQTAKRLWGTYILITLAMVLCLWGGPMSLFDAVCHSFAATSTGGYSTKQASIGYWDSAYVDYVVIVFMLLSSVNFVLVFRAISGNPKPLFTDEEVRWFLSIVAIVSLILTAILYFFTPQWEQGVADTFRISLFQVSTLISTTGFGQLSDFTTWGTVAVFLCLALYFFGSCAGSTCGGAKIARMIVVVKNLKLEFYRQLHPNAVVSVRMNDKYIAPELITKVMVFVIVYIAVICIATLFLCALGMEAIDSFGSTLSAISNVGPGIGITGPVFSYSEVPILGKWVLSATMLIGRLELYTVLVIFTSYFWKK